MVDILYVSDRMSGFFVYTYHVVQQKMREECQESRGEGRGSDERNRCLTRHSLVLVAIVLLYFFFQESLFLFVNLFVSIVCVFCFVSLIQRNEKERD